MTLRTFATVAFAGLVLAACGTNSHCTSCGDDTDETHTGINDLPATSELQVNVTKLGVTEDCVATINDGDKTEVTAPSGTVNEVHAGTWSVTAGSSPFNSEGQPTHTDTDGVSWIGGTLEVDVAKNDSVTVELPLNRYLDVHDRYHCTTKDYLYDADLQGPATTPYDEIDHGYFTFETLKNGALKIYLEDGSSANEEMANSNSYAVHGASLLLTGDEDGKYPERLESSTIEANGDLNWLIARPIEMYPIDNYVPGDYVHFVCTIE